MNPVTTSLLCLVGWLNAYLQSTVVWNVWEALRMFSVSTAIEQERQTEDKVIMYNQEIEREETR